MEELRPPRSSRQISERYKTKERELAISRMRESEEEAKAEAAEAKRKAADAEKQLKSSEEEKEALKKNASAAKMEAAAAIREKEKEVANAETRADQAERKTECPVCFEPMKTRWMIMPCGHSFCGDCKDSDMYAAKICPTCRGKVERHHQVFL